MRLTRDNYDLYAERASLIPHEESKRLFDETGKGLELPPLSRGALEKSVKDGGVVYVGDDDGREGERIFVWAHREPEGWYVSHAWGPSERHLEVLMIAATSIIDAGGGREFSHYPNVDMPICKLATQIVKPEAGSYVRGEWVANRDGPLARVITQTSLDRLLAFTDLIRAR